MNLMNRVQALVRHWQNLKKIALLTAIHCLFAIGNMYAQANIRLSSTEAENVLLRKYDPAKYGSAGVKDDPDTVSAALLKRIHPDSLKQYILTLASFYNRNIASDTLSAKKGIGAARRWILGKFNQFSKTGNNRLLPSYQTFDLNVCNMSKHRNVIAVLPGTDTSLQGFVLIEGHMDSRCEGNCDTGCLAQGVEDNATGTALVIELARVLSGFRFPRTIVFMATTGEEQGLYGAYAMTYYCQQKKIPIHAVLNNDVIGGVICGKTSSPPSCPGENLIDSTHVRLFSFGNVNSPHKQLSRFIKLQYRENLLPRERTPMELVIMSSEDRTGRGGDHIPFRINGYRAMRFTSSHEHGDANVAQAGYTDRQHSTRDIAGIDKNSDQALDSFFVDFRYLARNSRINGCAAAMAAMGPNIPLVSASAEGASIRVQMTAAQSFPSYRIAIRSGGNDWDSVFTVSSPNSVITPPFSGTWFVSGSCVNSRGTESLFSDEQTVATSSMKSEPKTKIDNISFLPNRPNPFDEATWISWTATPEFEGKDAVLVIGSATGEWSLKVPVVLKSGLNEYLYEHEIRSHGMLTCTLQIGNQTVARSSLMFAN